MARVRLLQNEEAPQESRELLEKITANGAAVLNLYRVAAHSPGALPGFIKLGHSLMSKAELSPRLRELAILRIASLLDSGYEWDQHVPIALETGITREQMSDIHLWEESARFSAEEKAVLRYTDEVTLKVQVKDRTFEEMRRYLSERSAVELTLSIGYWGMIARTLVSLDIDMDEHSAGSARNLLGQH